MYILHNDASVNSSSVGKVVACTLWYVRQTCPQRHACTRTTHSHHIHPHTHTSVYPCQKLLPQHVVLLARVPECLTQCSELRVGEGGLAPMEVSPCLKREQLMEPERRGSKSRKCSDTCVGGGVGREEGGERREEGRWRKGGNRK